MFLNDEPEKASGKKSVDLELLRLRISEDWDLNMPPYFLNDHRGAYTGMKGRQENGNPWKL